MRSQRLVACLLLLQGSRRLTAASLATALEVSQRTIYRDIEALSEAGVPIHAERGVGGGIVLADGYRHALAAFDETELQALFAVSDGPLSDLGSSGLSSALRKLAGALSEKQQRIADAGRSRLIIDHNRWGREAPDTDLLRRLRSAVTDDRSIELDYRDRAGAVSTRRVDPLGLIAKAGVWYLVARESEKGERTFRVDRIAAAHVTDARFSRPTDFNLNAHWQASLDAFKRRDDEGYAVTLRVRHDALATFAPFWQLEHLAEDATTATVRVRFPTITIAAAQFIIYGTALELLEPLELAATVARHAREALDRYGDSIP